MTELTVDLDDAAMGFHDLAHVREPETDTSDRIAQRAYALKRREDELGLVSFDTDTVVGDAEDHRPGVAVVLRGHLHGRARGRVLDRVAHEVVEHLLNAGGVTRDEELVGWQRKIEAMGRGARLAHGHRVTYDVAEVV